MSMHMAKGALRQAKNIAKGFTDTQTKVREATSNDPWGPSGTQMAELADASFRGSDFIEIMDMLDKRLNDSGKNWRHVFKALTLLDYMIHCGSEQVIAYAKQNLYVIKTLKEFQFIDEEGKDQGANVREKSKAIASLLADDDRLKEERRARAALRDRMGGSSNSGANNHSAGGDTSSSSVRPNEQRRSFQPASAYEEEHQIERAIEESKRTAVEHERRMRERAANEDNSYQAPAQSRTAVAAPQQQQVDLWGGGNMDQKQTDLDFFSSMASPAPVNPSNHSDPFGFPISSGNQPQNLFATPNTTANPFGGSSSQAFNNNMSNQNMFQQQQQQQFTGGQQQQMVSFGQQQSQPFAQPPSFPSQQSQQFGASNNVGFPQQQQQNSFGNSSSFDATFDTGAGQKNLVPRNVQGQYNPNAQLAQIARNATQIDPFANIASKSGNNSVKNSQGDLFGASNVMTAQPASQNWSSGNNAAPNYNMTGQSMGAPAGSVFAPPPQNNNKIRPGNANPFGGQGQQQQRSTGPDPFAALAPFPTRSQPQQQQQQQIGMGGQQQLGSQNYNKPAQGMMVAAAGNNNVAQFGMGQQPNNGQNFGQQQANNNNGNFFF